MDTDWLVQEPIDFEHKKYVLLGYFKKIDQLLDQNKLYPTFIELSLHLASLQTLIKEKLVLYTEKNFLNCDEEVLIRDLLVKPIPELSKEEIDEFDKILKFSSKKFFEYFSIVKSYWSVIYETISINVKKNKKNIKNDIGFLTYNDKKNNKIYVWEYVIKKLIPNMEEYDTNVTLIYEGQKKGLTFNQVIENFSTIVESERVSCPVFEVKASGEYPLNETLLPLFKRKLMSYILQSVKLEDIKKYEA